MISNAKDRQATEQVAAQGGAGSLMMERLLSAPNQSANLRTFGRATLAPGCSVGYHIHKGESESYYILSGKGLYNDNGTLVPVSAGDVTFTPDGEGHGIENNGDEPLVFIALIILD